MKQSFKILGEIRNRLTFATGNEIRDLPRLNKIYGKGRWRKRKGYARIQRRGKICDAEIHWYEAHGIGQVEFKIKRIL